MQEWETNLLPLYMFGVCGGWVLCCPGWPQTQNHPASASQEAGLHG